MATVGLDDLERNATEGKMLKGLLGLTCLLGIGKYTLHVLNEQEKQKRIYELDRQISDYKGKFLGEFLYSNEIEELEKERKELMS